MSLQHIVRVPSGRPDTDEMPMVVVMHGRGADANDLADIAPMLDGGDGFRFLFPNAPKPWEAAPGQTYGFTWFDGWPPKGTSLAESRKLLLDFIEEAATRYPTPPGKIVIAGFSQGALMALDAGLRSEHPVAGVVAMSGGLFEEDLSHLSRRKDVPVLIVHGTGDEVVPVTAARRARHLLGEYGLQPEYHEYPMEHQLSAESLETVRKFITRVLSSPEA